MITNREVRALVPDAELKALDKKTQGEGGEFSTMSAPGWAMVIRPGVRLEAWTPEEQEYLWLEDEQTWDHERVQDLLKKNYPQIESITTYMREEGDEN